MKIDLLENIHPLIKCVAEAIATPASNFFVRYSFNKIYWEVILDISSNEPINDKTLKFIVAYPDKVEAEDVCEKLNQYNLAKAALIATREYRNKYGAFVEDAIEQALHQSQG